MLFTEDLQGLPEKNTQEVEEDVALSNQLKSTAPEDPNRLNNYVLLVEKDPLQRFLLEVSLVEAGWAVRVAEGPADALRCCEHDFFDVAIINSHYPDKISGWTLANTFRQAYELPSLMITSSRIVELKASSGFTEKQEFLLKPYRLMDCRQRLYKILADRARCGEPDLSHCQQLV